MPRVWALLSAFILGLVLYLFLGETGWVTWHRSGGMRPGLSLSSAAAAPDAQASTAPSAPAAPTSSLLLNSFESKADCLVAEDGYSQVERSGQKVSEGDHSLKAVFLLRTQFYPSPAAQPSPYPRPIDLTQSPTPSPTPVWRPRLLIGMGAAAKLKRQDFSAYRSLKLDVFNPEDRPINAYLEIADSRGYSFSLPAVGLSGQKISTLGADLTDLASQDLDLKHIRHVAFHVDVSGRASSPVLYLDNFRLEK